MGLCETLYATNRNAMLLRFSYFLILWNQERIMNLSAPAVYSEIEISRVMRRRWMVHLSLILGGQGAKQCVMRYITVNEALESHFPKL